MKIFALLALLSIAGCSSAKFENARSAAGDSMPTDATTALRMGTDFQLYSLEPDDRDKWPNPDGFHNFVVLGSTHPSQAERKQLIDSLIAGVSEHDGSAAACFDPRHGIRVLHEGKRHDFVICFECAQIYWYTNDTKNSTILTSGSSQPAFDQILTEASIALADPT